MERAIAVATETDGGAAMRASIAERAEPARAPSSLVGVNRWVALAAALLLHGGILAALLIQFDWGQRAAPPAQEIPVEIVVEQPKSPEPQPQPSTAPPPPLDIAPAHDAPRAASEETTPRFGSGDKTKGEKAPTPDAPQAGATPPPNEAAKSEPAAPAPSAPAKDDGGEQQASDETPRFDAPAATLADAPDSQTKVATMTGQPLPTWSAGKQFAALEPTPDLEFEDAGASPIGGGHAPTNYLTIVYGLVMKHIRFAQPVLFTGKRQPGAIDFVVGRHGELVQRSVAQSSGSNALDAAALEAVSEAAPYPPLPNDAPYAGIRFTYGGK